MNNEKSPTTHHLFMFVAFGTTVKEAFCVRIFNDDQDCGNIRLTLERATEIFKERYPHVSAAVFLSYGTEDEAILYELYDTHNTPTSAKPSHYRPQFRKGNYFLGR